MTGIRWRSRVILILSAIGVLLVITFASLMFISGVFREQKYLQPWKPSYSAAITDPRVQLAAHGLLAASSHNMQPWKIKLDSSNPLKFALYADSERLSPAVDPYARQFMVSQGTFLEYVRVAGKELGYETAIELFPEGDYDEKRLVQSMRTKPVAVITLTRMNSVSHPLYKYLFLSDTNRGAYRSDALRAEQVDELQGLQENKDISLKIVQDPDNKKRLATYITEASIVEAGVDTVMEESARIFRSNEKEKNKYRYGFSVEGQGTDGLMRHMLQGLVTLFPSLNKGEAASKQFITSTETSVNNTPAFAMIRSADNSRLSQVRSGMLYSRLVLSAHRLGLAIQPLSQVLEEYPEMSRLYSGIHRSYAADGETIQMLMRIGIPVKIAPLSLRRDVHELLISESSE
ncbi:hypothetical protein NST07_04170 [Paenibacillus sp. FSL L8-0340]|uniref:Acg family FMN-binding oxidoreductase n=1 Tax=Paenibacillus sp. FSL L8-0340 TaxID=2954685 RepID=UPI0031597E9B